MQFAGYSLYQTPPNPLNNRSGADAVEGTAPVLELVHETLSVPSLVRPDHERDVLYIRLTAPRAQGSRIVAVVPDAGAAVAAVLSQARERGEPIHRAVVVGVDALLSCEACPGLEEARATFVDVVRALTDAQIAFLWRTRAGIDAGGLPPGIAHALIAAGRLCTVELGVATVDDDDARALEGDSATSAASRVRLAASLVARGVSVRALVDPLVPMLTDQQAALDDLVTALASAGVKKLGARYITLTRERAKVIALRLAGMQKALLQGVFADEPWRTPGSGAEPDASGPRELHKRIPAALRMRGHERLLEIGAQHGVVVEILDPVDERELGHLNDPSSSSKPRSVRVRPQLDLFQAKQQPKKGSR
ncbi:MAG: hypothetical protein Q8O67_06425 [Deltaproteobacteria bacterium]|nr:hypothetical protein [Deltaproteobacteria bacterium]